MQQITTISMVQRQRRRGTVNFYASIFKDAKITEVARYGFEAGPGPKGSVMTMKFQLNGLEFVALNGGPNYTFTHAVSFVVNSREPGRSRPLLGQARQRRQAHPVRLGWLVDKYGLSWQIVPTILPKLLQDKDPAKSKASHGSHVEDGQTRHT